MTEWLTSPSADAAGTAAKATSNANRTSGRLSKAKNQHKMLGSYRRVTVKITENLTGISTPIPDAESCKVGIRYALKVHFERRDLSTTPHLPPIMVIRSTFGG